MATSTPPPQREIDDAARAVQRASANAQEMFGLLNEPLDETRFQTSWITVVRPGWEQMSIAHDSIEQIGRDASALSGLPALADNAEWHIATGLLQDLQYAATLASNTETARAGAPHSHARPGVLTRAIAHGLETLRHLAISGADRADRHPSAGREAGSYRKAATGLRRIAVSTADALDTLLGGDGSLAQEATVRDVERYASRDRGRTLWDEAVPGPRERTHGMHTDLQLVHLHGIELRQADVAHQASLAETTGAPDAIRSEIQRGLSRSGADPMRTQTLAQAGPSEIHIARTLMYKNAAARHEANAGQIRDELRARSEMSSHRNRVEENIRRGTHRAGPASVIAAQAATQQLAMGQPAPANSLR